MNIAEWLVVLYAFGAMVQDLRKYRISNRYLITGWTAGAVLALVCPPAPGVLQYPGGVLLPLLLMWPLFHFRMMGAGDVKLLSVLGGMLGAEAVPGLLACSFLAGAVMAAVILTRDRAWKSRFRFFYCYVKNYRTAGIPVPYRSGSEGRENLHFAVPVFAAVLLWKGGVF